MRRTAVIILIILVLIALCSSEISARGSLFEVRDVYWEEPLVLGAVNSLAVELKFLGESASLDLNATLKVFDVAGTTLESSSTYAGYIGSGGTIKLVFNLSIPENARSSYYIAKLELNYTAVSVSGFEEHEFQVGFLGEPSFSLELVDGTAVKGKLNTVRLRLEVYSTPARAVEIRVTSASPFITIVGTNIFNFGLMEVGDVKYINVTMMVDSTAGDSGAITVTISYADFQKNPQSTTVTLGFSIKTYSLPSFAAYVYPKTLISGKISDVVITLENIGAGLAREVFITLSPAGGGVGVLEGMSAYVSRLSPGGVYSFRALMRADRGFSGTTTLRLSVSYLDEGGDRRHVSLALSIEVARSDIPVLMIETPASPLTAGKECEIALRVRNVGGEEAQEVVIDFLSSENLFILRQSRCYFKVIRSGEALDIRVKAFISKAAGGAVVLNARLRYRDPYGNEFSDGLSIALRVESPPRPNLEVATLNNTIGANQLNRVIVAVRNNGPGRALNVTLALTSLSAEAASVVGSSSRCLGVLNPGSESYATYEVFVQPKVYGAIQLVAALSYEDELGKRYEKVFTLGFRVEGEHKLAVVQTYTKPSVVFPGDKLVRVYVVLANIGDYVARNLEVEFRGNAWIRPSTASSAGVLIPYLPVGQTFTALFLVDISEETPPGNHILELVSNNTKLAFQLTVLEKALFRAWNFTSLSVFPGARGVKVMLVVKNISNTTATEVRVDIFSPFLTGSTSTYVGEMRSQESRLVVFEVDVSTEAPLGTLPLEVRITWTQEGRKMHQTSTLVLEVYRKRSLLKEYGWIFLVFIIALIVILVLKNRERIAGILESFKG